MAAGTDMENKNAAVKLIANNKKAYHDYFIIEKYECGIELYGTEIKSVRMGRVSIKEAYVDIENGEAWIDGMNISPYEMGNLFNRDPLRRKKLLLHKNEIRKLAQAVQQDGYTIVPLSVYLKKGRAKVEIGLAKGKHVYDKREDIRKRDLRRETERDYKDVMKY